MKVNTKKLAFGISVAIASGAASAGGTADTEFKLFFDKVTNWTKGYLAKGLALVAFLFGAGAGVVRGTIAPAIVGVAFALLFAIAPGMIGTMVGATL